MYTENGCISKIYKEQISFIFHRPKFQLTVSCIKGWETCFSAKGHLKINSIIHGPYTTGRWAKSSWQEANVFVLSYTRDRLHDFVSSHRMDIPHLCFIKGNMLTKYDFCLPL